MTLAIFLPACSPCLIAHRAFDGHGFIVAECVTLTASPAPQIPAMVVYLEIRICQYSFHGISFHFFSSVQNNATLTNSRNNHFAFQKGAIT